MPSAPVPLAGIVLAGGASRRMGTDKATLPVPGAGGATMIERTVATVGARCRPVIVIAAAGQPLPDLPARVLRDETPGLGPLSATGRGLRAAADAGVAWAFVSAVDLPLLTAELIDELAVRAAGLHAEVVLPWDGRDHYLAALYRTALAGRAEALLAAGERSMRALVRGVDAQRIVLAGSRASTVLTNVNSPADLHALGNMGARKHEQIAT
ncbi:MAG TPA: molybdenum cofactor guanylyltransferase [Mycobacterium sp.]|nr:molybdenum cofactor guanylyltransferase [Mycobacterium sp.]